MAENKVVAGEYVGTPVTEYLGNVNIGSIVLDKSTAEKYEIVSNEKHKSALSGLVRGALGYAVLGPIGLAVGFTAKNVATYNIIFYWKDGKKSLVEVDEKLYKSIVKVMF